MAYDLHGSWEKVTGHNSPLYKRQGESGAAAEYNVVSDPREEAGFRSSADPARVGGPLNLKAPNGRKIKKQASSQEN